MTTRLTIVSDQTPANSAGALPPEAVVFGRSEAMLALQRKVERVASADVPVLIQGESGTGKEVLARLIHLRSPLADAPFVKVCCPAIPGTLLESELFGYEKGAFTGANTPKPGRVEMANGGTLFLDEIGELDMSLQAKLLQFLQDGRFTRIGGKEELQAKVRVICSTQRQLERDIEASTFRQDLFYRINVVNLQLPPLRLRREDIAVLVGYMLNRFRRQFGRDVPEFSPETMQLFRTMEWPGNIRELENWIARYVILGSEMNLRSELMENVPSRTPIEVSEDGTIPLKRLAREAARNTERTIILKTLQANRWNRRKTAKVLRISYRALLYKIREAGLGPKRAHVNSQPLANAAPSD